MLKGSLKRLNYGNGKNGYGGDTPCSVSNYADDCGSLKRIKVRFRLPLIPATTAQP
ncbi:hypothetical protein [Kingella sp. (in: b-proteobacteria)]|uniref:hypothetical protein n=1 Tax=Kingella sp. (in: b-proteobacteria) TaxID=2020713 RepID=UPI0026DBBD27|nr:hypothetical protein [Kingella sp. (in: b-proteobacteria)]